MGCVLSWGNNEYGQLGREIDTDASETGYGRYSHEMYPCVQFSDDTNRITLIACGDLHCLALARDGIQVITTFWIFLSGTKGMSCVQMRRRFLPGMICRCIAGAARPTGASGTNATTIIKSSLGQWDLQSMIHTCPYQAAWRTRRRLLAGSRLLLSVGSLELCTNCGCDTNVSHYLHARQAAVLFWQKRRWSVRFLQLGGSRAPEGRNYRSQTEGSRSTDAKACRRHGTNTSKATI